MHVATLTETKPETALVGGYGNLQPGKSASVELRGGVFFDVFKPDIELINSDRMAHALSNQCRFSGHTNRHYSVAEHSVHVSIMAEKTALARGHDLGEALQIARQALIHDGSEAVLQDVPSPIKKELPEYKKIEAPIQAGIFAHHGLDTTMHSIVHEADMRMCITEKLALIGEEGLTRPEWAPLTDHYEAYRFSFLPKWFDKLVMPYSDEPTVYFHIGMSPARAKRLFLKRYRELFA